MDDQALGFMGADGNKKILIHKATNQGFVMPGIPLTGDVENDEVLFGKTFYNTSHLSKETGTMPNNGDLGTQTLNVSNTSYTVPLGYTDGGTIKIDTQTKTATPSLSQQSITPDSGKVLSEVKVNAVSLTGSATAGSVLSGGTFYNTSLTQQTGTMSNQGAWTSNTTSSGNVTIPAGYHNGSGYVSGAGAYNKGVSDADARTNTSSANYQAGYNAGVAATKVGTAGTSDVLSGKTFTNASSVGATGTMTNRGAWTGSTSGSGNVIIPAGYHNGSGYVSGSGAYNAGVSATKVGTAGQAQVLTGYTFTNASSVGASGTMVNNGALGTSLNCGGSYTIPAGYTSGGTVTANSLASQTSGTADASKIISGYTAWVNGSQLTGTGFSGPKNLYSSSSYTTYSYSTGIQEVIYTFNLSEAMKNGYVYFLTGYCSGTYIWKSSETTRNFWYNIMNLIYCDSSGNLSYWGYYPGSETNNGGITSISTTSITWQSADVSSGGNYNTWSVSNMAIYGYDFINMNWIA